MRKLRLHGVRQGPEIMALAGLEDRTLGVLVWQSPSWQRPQAGALALKFPLPRQAVSLVTLRW